MTATLPHRPEPIQQLWLDSPLTRAHRSTILWSLAAGITVLLAVAWRLAYLVWWCPFDLAPDEAHYWDWSRQLDWCYYSKGPIVAWLIRLSETLTGSWLRDVHATAMPAVRLPAVLSGAVMVLGTFVFTWQVTASPALAYLVLVSVMLTPHFSVLSTVATIDPPQLCLWQWSLVTAYHALGLGAMPPVPSCEAAGVSPGDSGDVPSSRWASWLVLGVLVGLGILAKPTMVLFPLCLMIFLAIYRGLCSRRLALPLLAAAGLAGLIGAGPILLWNAQHDWVTFRHAFTQATLTGPSRWRPWGWVEYLGVQTAVLFGVGMLAWCAATVWAWQRWRHNSVAGAPVAFLVSFSWPVFAVFALFSLRTSIQPNWPAPAYLAAIPLVALWMRSLAASQRKARWLQAIWLAALVLSSMVTLILHRPQIAYQVGLLPALARYTGHIHEPQWPRRFDPTCRFQGWRELAQEVQQLRQQCRASGVEPILAATPYGTAAELAFYLPDQPRVFCLNRANGLRYSQYDLWRPNPIADPQFFAGRSFLIIGTFSERARAGFARVELVQTVIVQRHGFEIAREWIYLAHDFRGFPDDDQPPLY